MLKEEDRIPGGRTTTLARPLEFEDRVVDRYLLVFRRVVTR